MNYLLTKDMLSQGVAEMEAAGETNHSLFLILVLAGEEGIFAVLIEDGEHKDFLKIIEEELSRKLSGHEVDYAAVLYRSFINEYLLQDRGSSLENYQKVETVAVQTEATIRGMLAEFNPEIEFDRYSN